MSSAFHVAVGPFIIDVRLDDSGIHMQRGAFSETVAWERISGATLLREPHHDESQAQQDDKNHLHVSQIPAALDHPAFLQEFETRLGPRWLGESVDRQQAAKQLHTNPGFFKMRFVLVALFGIIAVVAAIALLGFLGPVLNFLSIQRMLLDLQDGNLMSFASRLATYVALLVIGFLLHRTIRGLFASQRARIVSKLPGKS
jgi:hypothetical protein